jgi:hypothetical protein
MGAMVGAAGRAGQAKRRKPVDGLESFIARGVLVLVNGTRC